MAICKNCGGSAFTEDYHDDCIYAGLTPKQIRFKKFEAAEAKRLEDLADESEANLLVISGKIQGIMPIVTAEGQALADEMGVSIGETKGFYLQPPNRQYFRRAFKEQERKDRSTQRKEFLAAIKPKENLNPTKLPTHMIHKIYAKSKMSIRWKQNRIGTVGIKQLDGSMKQVFNAPLFWKIIERRGKNRAVRKLMENESRVVNRAA